MGLIYKLTDNTNGDIYIGSTKRTLHLRLQDHQYRYKETLKKPERKMSSFSIIKNNDYKIELVEEVDDENLVEREKYYFNNTNNINIQSPYRTEQERKQWIIDHKEHLADYQKQYCIDNKVAIKKRQKAKREWEYSMGRDMKANAYNNLLWIKMDIFQ